MKKLKLILVVLLFTSILSAQSGGSVGVTDAISSSMGNTYITNSTGVYSIGKNPANLMFSEDNHFEFATVLPFPNFGVYAGADFMTFEEFNYYFGGEEVNGEVQGRYLTDEDKTNLKNLFEEGGITTIGASINYFSFMYKADKDIGAFGFSISDNFGFSFDFPAGIVDLALEGNPIGSVYSFDGAHVRASYYRDYTLSYAREFTDLFDGTFEMFSAGLSMKIIQGFAYIETERMNSSIETGPNSQLITKGDVLIHSAFSPDFGVEYDFDSTDVGESNVSPFPTPAGSGFGVDLGFAVKLDDIWTFGLAITDIGSINFTERVAEYKSDKALILEDISNQEERDSLSEVLKGEGSLVDEVSSALPTVLRMGASARIDKLVGQFPGTLLVALDYNQGFNNKIRNSTTPRFSLGAEWRPFASWPIRTGFSFGGRDGAAWSLGTGVDFGVLEMNISAFRFGNLLAANNASKFSVAFGSRWKF